MIPLNQHLSSLKPSSIRVFTNLAAATPGCISLTIGEPDGDTPALHANTFNFDESVLVKGADFFEKLAERL